MVKLHPPRVKEDEGSLYPLPCCSTLSPSFSPPNGPRATDYQSVSLLVSSNSQCESLNAGFGGEGSHRDHTSHVDLEEIRFARSDESPKSDVGSQNGRLVAAGVAVTILIIGGVVAASTGVISKQSLVSLAEWFATLGPNAIFLYGTLYFVLELLAVPALPLTLGAGYLFGVVYGTIAVSISSSLAAVAAFLIARYGLRDVVTNLAGRFSKFNAIDRVIEREGFKFVFLLRLSPLLPFSISNYLYGLTSVDFVQFCVASWLGMLPGTIAYVSTGAAINALTELESGNVSHHMSPVFIVLGVAGTIGVLWLAGRLASRVVTDIADEESDESIIRDETELGEPKV